jgi:galactose mutarotase-like enzyme
MGGHVDYSSGRNGGCRILEYRHRSLTHIVLENSLLRVTVLPDKGSDIVEFRYKPTDSDFLWRERNGLRDPGKVVPTGASPLGANLDWYEGGWHECLPGGGPTTICGAAEGLHGEAALLPWRWAVEEDNPGCVRLSLSCELLRLPLAVRKVLTLEEGRATLDIEESLTNLSSVPLDFLWGHHPTFGAPFLGEECRIDVPARRYRAQPGFSAPRMLVEEGTSGDWPITRTASGATIDISRPTSPESGYAGLLCLDVEEGRYSIVNELTGLGFELRWDREIFPYLYFWHVYGGIPDYPWYGMAYVVGLEPWTSFPMNHELACKSGTALRLEGRGRIETTIKAVVHSALEGIPRIASSDDVE